MRILILSRNKQLHSIRRLLAEARRLGLHCDVIDPLDCQIVVDGKKSGIMVGNELLPKYDVVLPRIGASITDYGIAVVKQLENLKVIAVNGSLAIAQSRDKMRCLQILANAGLRVPRTVLTRNTRGGIKSAIEKVGGMPVVMKVLQGTQGLGVMLVHSPISLATVLETLQGLGQEVLLQEFIAEGAGRDYRAFVIGNKVVAAMLRRAPAGEFRTNIHRGGEGVLIKLPRVFERAAVRACRILGLQIAGVDMMESKGKPLIIEVNSSPGFEGIERVTRLNVGAAMMRHIRLQGQRS